MRSLLPFLNLIGLVTTRSITIDLLPDTSTKLNDPKLWHITNFVAFEASDEAKADRNCSSYIHFNFEDVNRGLALNTTCTHTIAPGSDESLSDSSYRRCMSDYVNFVYTNGSLQLERLYRDPSVGDPPYDSVIAFGRGKLNCTKTKVPDGILMTQAELFLPITSLIG